MAPHSSTLAWKIPRTEEPGGLQSTGLQKVDTTKRLTHNKHCSLSLKRIQRKFALFGPSLTSPWPTSLGPVPFAIPHPGVLIPSKGSCVQDAENQTLSVDICSKGRVYFRPPSKGVGDKSQIHSNLVYELGCFYRRRTKKLGWIIFLWHFLIVALGVKVSSGYDSLARWSMAWGPVSPSCLDKQPEFVC